MNIHRRGLFGLLVGVPCLLVQRDEPDDTDEIEDSDPELDRMLADMKAFNEDMRRAHERMQAAIAAIRRSTAKRRVLSTGRFL